jgi:D-xylose transport system ATP-binding protein
VQALQAVDFEVRDGEVMALVGDNGAGKSTLIKCVAGIYSIDDGQIFFDGEPVDDPRAEGRSEARDRGRLPGPGAVRQPRRRPEHVSRPRDARSLFRLREAPMEQRTAETLKSLSVTTIRSVRQAVATLSGGQRQSVAVARAVLWNNRVVFLDEPTAALGVAQTRQVLDLVKRLAEQGLAVVLVSHNLVDVFEVADRITVLRLGRNVGVYEKDKTNEREIVEAITFGAPRPRKRRSSVSSAAPAEVQAAAEDQDSIGAILRARWDAIRSAMSAACRCSLDRRDRDLLNSRSNIFFKRSQLPEPDYSMNGRSDR